MEGLQSTLACDAYSAVSLIQRLAFIAALVQLQQMLYIWASPAF